MLLTSKHSQNTHWVAMTMPRACHTKYNCPCHTPRNKHCPPFQQLMIAKSATHSDDKPDLPHSRHKWQWGMPPKYSDNSTNQCWKFNWAWFLMCMQNAIIFWQTILLTSFKHGQNTHWVAMTMPRACHTKYNSPCHTLRNKHCPPFQQLMIAKSATYSDDKPDPPHSSHKWQWGMPPKYSDNSTNQC